jgi:hypothetical protein
MLSTKLVKITWPPIRIQRQAPYTTRTLLAKPMLSNPGELDNPIAWRIMIVPARISRKPMPKPVSSVKYRKRAKMGGRLGSKPVLYVKTRVITENETIMKPNMQHDGAGEQSTAGQPAGCEQDDSGIQE